MKGKLAALAVPSAFALLWAAYKAGEIAGRTQVCAPMQPEPITDSMSGSAKKEEWDLVVLPIEIVGSTWHIGGIARFLTHGVFMVQGEMPGADPIRVQYMGNGDDLQNWWAAPEDPNLIPLAIGRSSEEARQILQSLIRADKKFLADKDNTPPGLDVLKVDEWAETGWNGQPCTHEQSCFVAVATYDAQKLKDELDYNYCYVREEEEGQLVAYLEAVENNTTVDSIEMRVVAQANFVEHAVANVKALADW